MTDRLPTLAEVEARYLALAGRRFADVLDASTLRTFQTDKGGSGRALEQLLGVPSGPRRRDLADGELKTFRCDADGFPLETVAITQISSIDGLLDLPPFAATAAYTKLRRVFFVGVWRPSRDPSSWRVPIAFRFEARAGSEWYERLDASYRVVLRKLLTRLAAGHGFATVSGPLLQMRVRDSRPYTPVFSERLGREVSNKRLGFYLTRRMLAECVTEARS